MDKISAPTPGDHGRSKANATMVTTSTRNNTGNYGANYGGKPTSHFQQHYQQHQFGGNGHVLGNIPAASASSGGFSMMGQLSTMGTDPAGAGNPTNNQLLSVLSSLVSSASSPASSTGNLDGQAPRSSSAGAAPPPLHGQLSFGALLPQLLQQHNQAFVPNAPPAPVVQQQQPQSGLGITDQQLVALFLQQQQQQAKAVNAAMTSSAVNATSTNPDSNNTNTAIQALLAQALGGTSSSSTNSNVTSQPAASSGFDLIALLSALSNNGNKNQPAASAAAVPVTQVLENSCVMSHSSGPFREQEDSREGVSKNGCKFLPCRARGMPMDHNIHTAFFEVPEETPHGGELVCSYPACRNSGVRFLYCKYCDAAISRRGFKTKHVHQDLRNAEEGVSGHKPLSGQSQNDTKKRKYSFQPDNTIPPDSVSHDSSSTTEAQGGGADKSAEIEHWGTDGQPKKSKSAESLRMNELKRDWVRLLEESRDHSESSDPDSKRAEWLRKVESIYDEYSTLGKLDASKTNTSPAFRNKPTYI